MIKKMYELKIDETLSHVKPAPTSQEEKAPDCQPFGERLP